MLKIKNLKIRSFSENIVYISTSCTIYDVANLKILTKLELHGGKKPVYAFLQTVDDSFGLLPTEIGLNQECFDDLGLNDGDLVSISVADTPASFSSIKRKVYGNTLSLKEFQSIVEDIKNKRYSNVDIAAFLVSLGTFMTQEEILSLTQSIISLDKITWPDEAIVADCYCIGGVPGNKIDLIIIAIVSAYGIIMPKTCSYSTTSCSGMGNVASVIMNIDHDENDFKNFVANNKGAIVAYDSLNISKFNERVLPTERYIGLSKPELLAASILAIKISCGVTHLLIDIPVGQSSRIRSSQEALKIRKTLEYLAHHLSLNLEVVISDGREPIGAGVGPVLEARDVMKVLKNQEDAPQDLKEKAIFMAGKILDLDPKLKGGQGVIIAKEILSSGRALEAFNKMVHAQGKKDVPTLCDLSYDFVSQESGTVKAINNVAINYLGILAGANRHIGAGVDIFKKIGDEVQKGDVLYTAYLSSQVELLKVKNFSLQERIYVIE